MVLRISPYVGYVDYPALEQDPASDRLTTSARRIFPHEVLELRSMAVCSGERQHVSFYSVNGPMLGLAKSGCVLNQRIQNGLKIKR